MDKPNTQSDKQLYGWLPHSAQFKVKNAKLSRSSPVVLWIYEAYRQKYHGLLAINAELQGYKQQIPL